MMPENKKMKKSHGKTGRFLLILLLLTAIIAVLLFLLSYLGNGQFGNGSGYAEGSEQDNPALTESEISSENFSDSESESESISETESVTEIVILDITVMGNVYLYQNQEILLDDLLSELQTFPDLSMVRIADDNATQNAMEDLLNALQESEITYALE